MLRPLDPVVLLAGPHKGTGGKVQKVNVDDDGKLVSYVVEQDVDNKLAEYKPAALQPIR